MTLSAMTLTRADAPPQVWGCGDQASRETQLEIKKWQVREAERQSKVSSSAATPGAA